MKKVGNKSYRDVSDIPAVVPVFPLAAALLLPGSQMPLNIFEPRYIAMFDAALAGHRLVGMVQPRFDCARVDPMNPELCHVGCLGRITSFTETGDGRYMVTLQGVARYRIIEELDAGTPFRQCRISPFASDLREENGADDVDRASLLAAFKAYLEANELEADWDSVKKAGNESLVNALCVMSPYGPAEKQAFLEAPDLKSRSETLVAVTELSLARDNDDTGHTLQ